MISKILPLFLCLATASAAARPGGFGAGNGGLGVACVHDRFDRFGGHQVVVEDARFFDLVRWGTLEDSERAFRYGSFTGRDAALEAALTRLAKLRADVMPAVRREMALIQGWVDRYITEFNNGYSYGNLESTDDYPDRPRRLYFCASGEQAKVYQMARYQSDGRFFLMIELYLALPPLDQAALMIHESIYRHLELAGAEPDVAHPVTRLTAALFATNVSADELRELAGIFPPPGK